MNFISSIILEDKFINYHAERVKHNGSERQSIGNLSRINVLIGPNNSGKSNFLRQLSTTEVFTYKPSVDLNLVNGLISDCREGLADFLNKTKAESSVRDIGVGGFIDLLTPVEYNDEGKNFLKTLDDFFASIWSDRPISYVRGNTRYTTKFDLNEALQNHLAYLLPKKNKVDEECYGRNNIKFKKLYIPTLRGLRGFSSGVNCYLDRTKEDYFKEGFSPEIFTGLGFYTQLRDLLLGNLDDRQIVMDFQQFLSVNFFYSQSLALIPRKDDDVIYVKIGNEEEFPIYRLGDGIQSIICLTFPLFMRQNSHVVAFIEEPELYMHPGLQRVLLNTLMQFENHQYFVTTHSNHFLDLTLEYKNISVYTFKKELGNLDGKIASATFQIENVSNDDLNTLELLGVRNSSVFLSNCTIWVEGITDRKYLQHCLNLYHKHVGLDSEYKLDTHYTFVEYSGGNITHWSFLDECLGINVNRLCGKLFLISDRDSKESYKALRHVQLQKTLGDRYYVLNCREMENTLTPRVLANVVNKYEEATVINQSDFSQQDYKDQYLGKYIEDVLLKGVKSRKGKYAEKSGTIAQKTKFWDDAITEIKSYYDLSNQIKNLVKKISLFIEASNS